MPEPVDAIPSDRVLGVPVAIAMDPLPENCCQQSDQCCRRGGKIPFGRRKTIARIGIFLASIVLLMGVTADAVGSQSAVWDATVYYDERVRSS
jgi:hypothetical protein